MQYRNLDYLKHYTIPHEGWHFQLQPAQKPEGVHFAWWNEIVTFNLVCRIRCLWKHFFVIVFKNPAKKANLITLCSVFDILMLNMRDVMFQMGFWLWTFFTVRICLPLFTRRDNLMQHNDRICFTNIYDYDSHMVLSIAIRFNYSWKHLLSVLLDIRYW